MARSHLLETALDMILGIAPDTRRIDHQVDLPEGSSVILDTDGLVERRGESVHDGLAHLLTVVAHQQELTGDALCDLILAAFGNTHTDDVALLVLHVRPT